MHQTLVLSLLTLAALQLTAFAAVGSSCNNEGNTGTCLETSSGCSGGEFVANLCPNTPADVECCIKYVGQKCGSSGTCQDTSSSCSGGSYQKGLCPGPSNIECCVKDCPEYWVVGVRGSNEAQGNSDNKDINAMGYTLTQYISNAVKILPSNTEYFGLPYPASLSSLEAYLSSESEGVNGLLDIVQARIHDCPNIKIGLAGYSQGAQVVNDALHNLGGGYGHIKAVLLLADPKADPSAKYEVLILPDGEPAGKTTLTGILGSQALPAAVQNVASAICFKGDIVCNNAGNALGDIIEFLEASIHSQYKVCCVDTPFVQILGAQLGNRMVA